MSKLNEIQRLLADCTQGQRRAVFERLREEFSIHPLEEELHAKAEIILEAIHRAGGLTLRMIRGVIAQAAFEVEVVERLKGWQSIPVSGDPAYDLLLKDRKASVRVQVKLQRSKAGKPWLANTRKGWGNLPAATYVVETQKTRGGKRKKSGEPTRLYRFSEFDLLAVATFPTTGRWDTFAYTVADWLVPDPVDSTIIYKYQPVAGLPNEDWTDQFESAVVWLRSETKKTIRAQ